MPPHRLQVTRLCLIDPVCFGMFMPKMLHNFIYKKISRTSFLADLLMFWCVCPADCTH